LAAAALSLQSIGCNRGPAIVRTFNIEGQPVRCIETDGKRLWLCECAQFKERATRHPEGFCGHTAVAIMRCIQDRSIEVT
jgi:hypothetical protein